MCVCVCVCVCKRALSCCVASDSEAPWTIAHHGLLSMGYSTEKCWSELPFPPPGDLHHPGREPTSLASHALASRFFTFSAPWEALRDHQ